MLCLPPQNEGRRSGAFEIHHPQTNIGREEFGRITWYSLLAENGRKKPWSTVVPTVFLELLILQSGVRSLPQGQTRQWRPVTRGVQPRGGAVWGLCERVSQARGAEGSLERAVPTRSVNRTPVLTEVATCMPALTPFVAKCYSERPADVFLPMDSGEHRTTPR